MTSAFLGTDDDQRRYLAALDAAIDALEPVRAWNADVLVLLEQMKHMRASFRAAQEMAR